MLLIAQRFDRRGVEALLPRLERQVDRELAHHRLAGTGRGTNQNPVATFKGFAGLDLERVEPERQLLGEPRQLRVRRGLR